jgi:N-acetylneuraminate lyase
MKKAKLNELVAATFTPFGTDGGVNLEVIEKQAKLLSEQQIAAVFICGSTGESHSLYMEERRRIAERWTEVTRGSKMKVIVHVGSNCLPDAQRLAAHAESIGAWAVSALAPSYFKPRQLSDLVEWCAAIAAMAPSTPFYYYDIPIMTGVSFPMKSFLEQAAERIPTLNGIKFTNSDLMSYQQCLAAGDGSFDIPWGMDEALLSALALGGISAVGSSYNFAAPIYHRLLAAFRSGDLKTARMEQSRSVSLIQLIGGFGYMGAAKAVLKIMGVDVGRARLPHSNLNAEQITALRGGLEKLGFFEWINFPQR